MPSRFGRRMGDKQPDSESALGAKDRSFMTDPKDENSLVEVSAHRWFRGSIGTAVGLAFLVTLAITMTPVFAHGFSFEEILDSEFMIMVGIIVFERLIFCYPYARYLRKKIRLGSGQFGALKGGMIGLLLSLIIVDGLVVFSYLSTIGEAFRDAGQSILVYFIWPLLALVAMFVGFGVGGFLDSQSRE